MIVPAIYEAATNYLWPGLQSTDNSGVYQNVLDGRSGGWWFGSGWCCSNPTELYGAWDFGLVIFEDVILIATGDDTRFCTDNPWNYNGATNVSITGVTSTVGVDTVTSNIDSITLWGPVW
ncbi:hypothetical protein D6C79_08110 [Aureobasidium pullulans]|nr:hypothetical protein D6C79_08110 [Aureobasidium pullulans]